MIVKIFDKEYCDENFILSEGYYMLSEEDVIKNTKEPVYEYITEDDIGRILKISDSFYETIHEFIEYELTIDTHPEYFL